MRDGVGKAFSIFQSLNHDKNSGFLTAKKMSELNSSLQLQTITFLIHPLLIKPTSIALLYSLGRKVADCQAHMAELESPKVESFI